MKQASLYNYEGVTYWMSDKMTSETVKLGHEPKANIGEQGLSAPIVWKSITTLIFAVLVLSYFVAG